MVCFACCSSTSRNSGIVDDASIECQRGQAIEQLRPSRLHLKIFALQYMRSGPMDGLEHLIRHVNPLGKRQCAVLVEQPPRGLQPVAKLFRRVSRLQEAIEILLRLPHGSPPYVDVELCDGEQLVLLLAKEAREQQPADLVLE